eukprot:10505731-Alexandrium_andersonii.AAC.1
MSGWLECATPQPRSRRGQSRPRMSARAASGSQGGATRANRVASSGGRALHTSSSRKSETVERRELAGRCSMT